MVPLLCPSIPLCEAVGTFPPRGPSEYSDFENTTYERVNHILHCSYNKYNVLWLMLSILECSNIQLAKKSNLSLLNRSLTAEIRYFVLTSQNFFFSSVHIAYRYVEFFRNLIKPLRVVQATFLVFGLQVLVRSYPYK